MKNLVLLIIIALLTALPAAAQTLPFSSPAQKRMFADYLFCKKDFLRAADEYSVCDLNDDVLYRKALCLLKIDKMDTADKTALQLSDTSFYSAYIYESFSELMNSGRYTDVISRYRSLPRNGKTPDSDLNNIRQCLWPMVCASGFFSDSVISLQHLNSLCAPEPFKVKFAQILNQREQNKLSPWKAAGLSLIVPGLGKIYTGRYSDGITAFVLTSLFAFLTSENIKNDHPARAWVTGLVTAFFYGGNVYGSYVSANIETRAKLDILKFEFSSFLSAANYFLPNKDLAPCP